MSILSNKAILAALEAGDIQCKPFVPEQVAQLSIDVHLHPKLLVYPSTVRVGLDDDPSMTTFPERWMQLGKRLLMRCGLSLHDPPSVTPQEIIIPDSGYWLMPGVGYLGATIERIGSEKYAGILSGKSSSARKGLKVEAAGLIERGFFGNVTLEIEVAAPLLVKPGAQVAQVRFETIEGESEDYAVRGHYTGTFADGPVASRSHLQPRRHVG